MIASRSSIWLRRLAGAAEAVRRTPSLLTAEVRHLDAIAERVRLLVAHLGLEQEAGGAQRRVDTSAVERAPPAVGPAGGVGDEHVPVELRVAGPAGAVPERGSDEAVTVDMLDTVVAASTEAGVLL